MIENQSDNIDNKENDVSDQENSPEDNSQQNDPKIDNDELSSQDIIGLWTKPRFPFLF